MNSNMLHTLARTRVQDIRRESRDRHLAGLARQAETARLAEASPRGGQRSGMRSRVGYTLVEAGLRLVATSGPRG
jgi:hypothetical protein